MDVTREADVDALVARAHAGVRPARHHDLQCRLRLLRHGRRDGPGRHAPDDGRQLHGDVLRRARRAAGLPAAGARPSDVRVLDRRQARHPVHERLQRHEGGAGGVRRIAALGAAPAPTSTSAPCFRCRRPRSSARRWSATSATRCPGSARSSRSTMSRERSSSASAGRGRGLSAPRVAWLGDSQRHRAGVHRSADAQVRPAPRRAARAGTSAIRTRTARHDEHRDGDGDRAPRARARRPRARGRRLGARSAARSRQARTSTSRSTALPAARLQGPARQRSAPVNTVGESFTVYKVARRRRVAAAPRVEDRPRPPRVRGQRRSGHGARRGGAAPRLHGQRDRLGSARPTRISIRSTAAAICSSAACCAPSIRATFGDDSLRVLRGIQFAARFEPRDGCRTRRRSAAASRSTICRPSASGARSRSCCSSPTGRRSASRWRSSSASIDRSFPELKALVGCPQEPEWHPGRRRLGAHAARHRPGAPAASTISTRPQQLTVMLGAVCHDLGKPPTTAFLDGRIRSIDHEQAGVAPTVGAARPPERPDDRRLRRRGAGHRHRRAPPQAARVLQVARRRWATARSGGWRKRSTSSCWRGSRCRTARPNGHIRLFGHRSFPRARARPRRRTSRRRSRSSRAGTCSSSASTPGPRMGEILRQRLRTAARWSHVADARRGARVAPRESSARERA